jgi:hypothetical protein
VDSVIVSLKGETFWDSLSFLTVLVDRHYWMCLKLGVHMGVLGPSYAFIRRTLFISTYFLARVKLCLFSSLSLCCENTNMYW